MLNAMVVTMDLMKSRNGGLARDKTMLCNRLRIFEAIDFLIAIVLCQID